MPSKERNSTCDILKGIGICLVVIAHIIENKYLYRIVFSFHMPLFFLIAGYFSKDSCKTTELLPFTIRNAKRLLIPYAITMFCICIWMWRFEILKFRFHFSAYPLLNMLWGSGDHYNMPHIGTLYVGPLWFLWALFIVKEVFGILQVICKTKKYFLYLGCITLSIIAIVIYPNCAPLAWNPFPGIGALIFYMIGHIYRRMAIPKWLLIFCIILWPISIIIGHVDMRECVLSPWPLTVLGACGATWLLAQIISLGNRMLRGHISRFFQWAGKISLWVLCIHSFDLLGGFSNYFLALFHINDIGGTSSLIHILVPFVFAYILQHIINFCNNKCNRDGIVS